MKLVFLVPNSAWVFLFGDSIVSILSWGRFFNSRADAVAAAASAGLVVDKSGNVSVEGE